MNEIERIYGSAVGITQTGEAIPLRVVGEDETEVPDTQGHKRVILWGHGGRLVTHTGKDATKGLRENDAQIYRHNGKVAIIDPETKRIKIVTPAEFGSWCEEHGRIVFQQFTRSGLEDKSLSEPESKALINNCKFIAGLRPLSRVLTAEIPFLNDGKLELQAAGYNAKTQSLTNKTVEYADKNLPLHDASATFNLAFSDVAWPPNEEEKKRGESVLIASMLTPYLACYFRPGVRRPSFLFAANEVGAGKTTCLYFALTTNFGAPIKTTAPPAKNDDANVSKLLDSVVQNGLSYLAIDNWDRKIDSGALAHLITANAMTGRILGGSAMFDAAVQCDIYITATTKHFSSEMRRRFLDVDLYVQQARAEDRPIKKPLDEYEVEAMRPELLSALWSYVLSWHEAGQPPGSLSHASFPEWGRIVGGILEHAGHVSPLLPARRVVDPRLDRFTHLVKTVAATMADQAKNEMAIPPKELMEIARGTGKFEAFLDPEPEEKNIRSERMKFKQQCDSYDEGRIFQLDDGSQVRFVAEGEGHSKRYVFTLL